MSMTLREVLKMPVTSAEEAEAWIKALVDNGFVWHFDDSPETIIYGKTQEPMFTEEEDIGRARINVAACFAVLDCPFETIIACESFDEVPADVARMDRLIDRGMSAEDAREYVSSLPEFDTSMAITTFMHCGQCLKELDGSMSPRDYASLEIGYTKRGFQVWCKRHECNVVHIDLEAHQHPAV